jgi:hypothetical protein
MKSYKSMNVHERINVKSYFELNDVSESFRPTLIKHWCICATKFLYWYDSQNWHGLGQMLGQRRRNRIIKTHY